MEMNRATLWPRILALLHAKQYLVFYAVALHVLDLGAVLLSAWLVEHRRLAVLIDTPNSLFGDLAANGTVAIAATAIGYLLVASWLRTGYLRSLVGRLHFGPRSGAQYRAMLALFVVQELIAWAGAVGLGDAENATPGAVLVLVALVGAYLLFLYTDYIIVVGNLGLLRAVVRSWQTVRANLWISFAVVLGILVALNFVAAVTTFDLDSNALDVLPTLVIRTLLIGSVGFLADVVLIVVYIESVESGRLPDGRG